MIRSLRQALGLQALDFTARHIFTARIRLVIHLSFWVFVIFFWSDLFWVKPSPLLIESLLFSVTTIAYLKIVRNRNVLFYFLVEIVADLGMLTLFITLTGGGQSPFFLLYLLYGLAAGLFYDHHTAFLTGILALIFYGALLLLGETVFPLWRPLSLLVAMAVMVWAIRIAESLNRSRERSLEQRNDELMALNEISYAVRTVANRPTAIATILHGVKEGLKYEGCLCLLVDEGGQRLQFLSDPKSEHARFFEEETKLSVNDLYIPMDDRTNPVFEAIRKRKMLIESDFSILDRGVLPASAVGFARKMQKKFGFQRLLAAPLFSEEKFFGALCAVTKKSWLEESAVKMFEGFANQAALVIGNVVLIEELRRKKEELEQVNRTKSEFMATMSHELRTPLNAIIGFSELLLEEAMGGVNLQQKESIQEVMNNGEHLLQLINNLLDLTKMEAGKMELRVEPLNIGELMEKVRRTISSLLQKKKQTLGLKVQESIPSLHADGRKVQQILLNLFSNAIKFTPEGGNLEVSISFEKDLKKLARQNLGTREILYRDGFFTIVVQDSGIGIAAKDLPLIFDTFKQVDSSYTRRYEGTGLGLALTKQFVEMHDGLIWAESEPKKGARFTVILPYKNPKRLMGVGMSEPFG
ncbi:MAG: ATP-binding protein [Deltaproteobacteria bacterium]|nr:ATP-binding protein [Deltaproteobacteria bacterium]